MRNGKIATLPSDIRDILSWRMEQGEKAGDLLDWLNGLPREVQPPICPIRSIPSHPMPHRRLRQRFQHPPSGKFPVQAQADCNVKANPKLR